MTSDTNMALDMAPRSGGRLSGRIYTILKSRLLAGAYTPGERLSVVDFSKEFKVSKQPIMEALRLLAGDGLIDIYPQVGSKVAVYSEDEVHDFFRIFAGLEGAVAEIAALRADPEAIATLRGISQQIGRLTSETSNAIIMKNYLVLNRDFHNGIHEMAKSRIISRTSQRMWDLSDFLISSNNPDLPIAHSIDERDEDHEQILQALEAGDANSAKTIMEEHIRRTADIVKTNEDVSS